MPPPKNVPRRPRVRSMNWSGTTTCPGAISSRRLPTALTARVGSAMPRRVRGRGRHMVGKNASGANPTAGHPPARRATGRSPATHGAQPVSVQASQQLGWFPTQALPPAGGWSVQDEELLLVLHFVVPLELVRQQVTNPVFPQVQRAAHFLAAP